ncbi:unnamed protein product, partial [Rotaria socialis]
WMSALELAKQKALKSRKQYQDSDEDISTTDDANDQQLNQAHQTQLHQQQQLTNLSDQTKLLTTTTERAELVTMNKAFDSK